MRIVAVYNYHIFTENKSARGKHMEKEKVRRSCRAGFSGEYSGSSG